MTTAKNDHIVSDQMGRKIRIGHPAIRAVSLVPSITEYLVEIGVEVVGRTKFCIHPQEKVQDIPVIGGTKKFRFDRIAALKPDVIVGNKEENYQKGILELEKQFPVWMSDVSTFEDQYKMMRSLGKITGRTKSAEKWIERVQNCLISLQNTRNGSVLYLIWKNPWMAVGNGTYIDSFLTNLGYENCVADERYPKLTDATIRALKPEVILLSSEPFPFEEKHRTLINNIYPEARVELVNGEMYSWYGSRIVHLV